MSQQVTSDCGKLLKDARKLPDPAHAHVKPLKGSERNHLEGEVICSICYNDVEQISSGNPFCDSQNPRKMPKATF